MKTARQLALALTLAIFALTGLQAQELDNWVTESHSENGITHISRTNGPIKIRSLSSGPGTFKAHHVYVDSDEVARIAIGHSGNNSSYVGLGSESVLASFITSSIDGTSQQHLVLTKAKTISTSGLLMVAELNGLELQPMKREAAITWYRESMGDLVTDD